MKTLLLPFLILTAFVYSAYAQTITFTDVNLKTALLNHEPKIDLNNNGEIEVNEAELVTELNLKDKGIISLIGLNKFTNLLELDCSENNIYNPSLYNIKLKKLNCSFNGAKGLEISNLSALRFLNCSYNNISSLTIGMLDSLSALDCSYNSLKNLDLYPNPAITSLTATNCDLEWLEISNLKNLNWLLCSDNVLEELDVTNNPKITLLDCRANRLSYLDLSKNTALMDINISDNNFANFDFSHNINVMNIFAARNPLKEVNVNCLPELSDFECQDCNLKQLDISDNSLNLWVDVRGNDSLEVICTSPQQNFGFLGRSPSTKVSTDCATGSGKCSIVTNLNNNLSFNKALIKTVDLQGREVNNNSTGLLIEFYNDGSKEKIWRE